MFHRLGGTRASSSTNAPPTPPASLADRRAEKIRRLRDDPSATPGEREAAQAALDRLAP